MKEEMRKNLFFMPVKVLFIALMAAASLLLLGSAKAPGKADPVHAVASNVARESTSLDPVAAQQLATKHPVVLLRANVRKGH